MRLVVIGALVGLSARVYGDPLETTGFFGVDYFGSHTGLGNSVDAEQIPLTSPMLGARLTYLAFPRVGRFAFGGELELGFTPAWTGYGFESRRMSYFSPVLAWRGSLLTRLLDLRAIQPHFVLGAGGESVRSQSPYMAKETDPVVYWGLGATFPVLDRWQVRFDARHGIMPARGGGVTSTFEAQLGIGIAFGLARSASSSSRRLEVSEVAAGVDKDSDGDGIPDRLDKCPNVAETVNGVEDADGCPEPDPDGDGIVGAADRCPDQPEDFDHFQDEDGCPDPDNDGDGIPDDKDACPNEAETFNLFEDEDGCPDQVPDQITSAFAAAKQMEFASGRARITPAAQHALDAVLGVLRDRASLHVVVIGHPAKDKDADLAKKRAEAVKWYLVDQGVAQDQIATVVGVAAKRGPAIEVQLGASPAAKQ